MSTRLEIRGMTHVVMGDMMAAALEGVMYMCIGGALSFLSTQRTTCYWSKTF